MGSPSRSSSGAPGNTWRSCGRRSLDGGFDIAPTVNVSIGDDVEAAWDAMRPVLALYIGGMGSREKNFYNQAVQRLGFEDAAREVQDLYLDGKKQEAAAALPGDLIDKITLCGPPGRIKDRLEAYKEAGVGTMIVTPMSFVPDERVRMVRQLAELL